MYNNILNPKNTPQTQQARVNQVPNYGGGYSFQVDDWTLLNRFLIMGTASNSYYAGAQQLTKEALGPIMNLIETNGEAVVEAIVEISTSGRAVKQDPALFLLAVCASAKSLATRKAAFAAINKVCRTGTHFLGFVAEANAMRGWGEAFQSSVANWFLSKDPASLGYQILKYNQRNGMSMRDVLRLAKPVPKTQEHDQLFGYVAGKKSESGTILDIRDTLKTKFEAGVNPAELASIVKEAKLPREAIPTDLLKNSLIWDAMLPDMPITALVRNLGVMTSNGTLKNGNDACRLVISKLTNAEAIKKSRIHPYQLFVAQRTYTRGQGFRGSNTWEVIPAISAALENAMLLSYGNLVSSGKRVCLAFDVSGSMDSPVVGSPFTSREATMMMGLSLLKQETFTESFAFSGNLSKLPFDSNSNLEQMTSTTSRLPFEWTDCALPMLEAIKHDRKFDAFIIFTDNDTNARSMHPFQALQQYRKHSGIDAKLVVAATYASKFSIADPSDNGMLDICGFDSNLPQLVQSILMQ